MTQSKASAFCPGHVTCFFSIHDNHEDILRRGSRGVGFCLSKGCRTRIEVIEGKEDRIVTHGQEDGSFSTEIQERVIAKYRDLGLAQEMSFKVESLLELPIGQGFGMSGAAALSTSLALSRIAGITRVKAVQIAHEVEVVTGGGLGDIAAQDTGGIVVRKMEGARPYCDTQDLDIDVDKVWLLLKSEKLSTKEIITNTSFKHAISECGERAMDSFMEDLTVQGLCSASKKFALDSGLAGKAGLLDWLNRMNSGSMVMLGRTLFTFDPREMKAIEDGNFHSIFCSIDHLGAKFIEREK